MPKPEEWIETTIEEILRPQVDGEIIHQGWSPQCLKEPAEKGTWGVLKTTAIQDGYFIEEENKKLPPEKDPKPRIEVSKNDLLMTNAGPRNRCGVVTLVRNVRDKLMISGKMYRMVFNSDFIDPRFIEAYLRTSKAQKIIDTLKTGISESGLNMTQSKFKKMPVLLAPFKEQVLISDQLEVYKKEVDTLKLILDNLHNILKRFRHSVIESAVSGKLTKDWRKDNDVNINNWKNLTVIDVVVNKPRNGNSPQGVEYETPYKNLTLSATTPGYFVEGNFKYVEHNNLGEDSYLWVKNGDILIQRGNTLDYVGVSAIYRGEDNRYVYPDLMMKCHPNEKIVGEYFHYVLLSDRVRKYFRENATGTAGNMPKINQATVCSAPVACPNIEEQTEIVRRVEQLFAFADKIEEKVNNAQIRVDKLTQSILKKTFQGDLTAEWREQNPDLISGENSAEALLARIKAEREALKPAKKTRKKTKA